LVSAYSLTYYGTDVKVFVAGATGVLGRAAVATLAEAGHDVSGVARAPAKAKLVHDLGARPVTVDLFDPAAVAAAVDGHEAVCNLATNIPTPSRYIRRSPWETNNRLHAEASRNLVDAALKAGAARYVQHSVAFMYAEGGDRWLDERAPLDPPPHGVAVLEAERQAQRFTDAGRTGVALRFGFFYGLPAKTALDFIRVARTGFVPMTGSTDAYVSWIHTDDLGSAVMRALGTAAGAYNVVDDEPITRSEWGGVLASALGRKRLRTPPKIAARLMGKRFEYLSRSQRVTNASFKKAGWSPSVPSARDGWAQLIADVRRLRT
jgi:nucleoside-diphosphate-sugar epimerase